MTRRAPLIAHVIHRLQVGGLENGLVNLINRIPVERYRHAIVSLTDATDFRERLQRDVEVVSLHKREGQDPGLYARLWHVFRRLRPAIVHTRNLATLEAQLPAALAGVRHRVHGEHGRDMHDLDNTRSRYRWMRRVLSPLIHRYIPLSQELERYLLDEVGIAARRITRICNGVDTERFRSGQDRVAVRAEGGIPEHAVLIGSVGRMEPVKDPLNLVEAYIALHRSRPDLAARTRLLLVGDGGLKAGIEERLRSAGLGQQAWLPGSRHDVPRLLAAMDVFVLPSLAEGISNTILEAMASALPIVATRVGGNAELVEEGTTAFLVPRADPAAMAAALVRYLEAPALRAAHGRAGRERAVLQFSMERMIEQYIAVYDGVLNRSGPALRVQGSSAGGPY